MSASDTSDETPRFLPTPDPSATEVSSDDFEGIVGTDERVIVTEFSEKLWRPICAILFTYAGRNRRSLGSGVLISPRLVLTAAHNLFDLKTKKPIMGGEVRVGVNGNQYEARSFISNVQIPWKYERFKPDNDRKYLFDFGLILLQDEAAYNWAENVWSIDDMTPMSNKELLQDDLKIAGYPAVHTDIERGSRLMVSTGDLTRKGIRKSTFSYDIDTSGGQSGCPVFHHNVRTGSVTLAGIHVAELVKGRVNLAKRFDAATKTRVQSWVQAKSKIMS